MSDRFLFTSCDEAEVHKLESIIEHWLGDFDEQLYGQFLEYSIDPCQGETFNCGSGLTIKATNFVEYEGTCEHQITTSSTYLELYVGEGYLGELCFEIVSSSYGECEVRSLEFIENEEVMPMAKLSVRVEDCPKIQNKVEEVINTFNTTQENTMNNTLQEITATLIDNNPHLEDAQRIVFQEKGIVTSASNEDIKLDLIATGKVIPALEKHNEEVRAETVREDILETTGREVMLKPIKKLSDSQLEWRFVPTA